MLPKRQTFLQSTLTDANQSVGSQYSSMVCCGKCQPAETNAGSLNWKLKVPDLYIEDRHVQFFFTECILKPVFSSQTVGVAFKNWATEEMMSFSVLSA